jgi:hypothetical protein
MSTGWVNGLLGLVFLVNPVGLARSGMSNVRQKPRSTAASQAIKERPMRKGPSPAETGSIHRTCVSTGTGTGMPGK